MPTVGYQFDFLYFGQPWIQVGIRTKRFERVQPFALIDTGAEISLFDASVATELNLDLTDASVVHISGVGGLLREALLAKVTLELLGEPELSITMEVAFAPDVETLHGNLIGLDVLEHFRFGVDHGDRIGYLSRRA